MDYLLIRKGLVLGIIVLFVGAGIIPSTIGTFEKKTSFTNPTSRGYIQDLIDNASNGDTIYVPSGIYYENIIINKSISLLGEDKDTTIIDGSNSIRVIYVTAYWVNISKFTIRRGSSGINLRSNNTTIVDNIISSNGDGIGIYESSNNTITNNSILKNYHGICIEESCNNTIIDNNIYNNEYGLTIRWNCCRNIVKNNSILNNKNRGMLITQSCNHNTIAGNTISNNEKGIFLGFSIKNTFKDNTISNNECGIDFRESSGNTIIGNNISLNNGDAIHFHSGWNPCISNIINGNTIDSNNGDGIYLDGSISSTITNNIIMNNEDGIFLNGATNNNILKNNFLDNKRHAFFRKYSANKWKRNYWNRPRILPKIIFGNITINSKEIPWINIDWRPAIKPCDIPDK